jgi:hypothetical protein
VEELLVAFLAVLLFLCLFQMLDCGVFECAWCQCPSVWCFGAFGAQQLREVAFGAWLKSPVWKRGAFGAVPEVALGAKELRVVAFGTWIKCPV